MKDPDVRDEETQQTALHHVIGSLNSQPHRYERIAEEFLQNGANPNAAVLSGQVHD